MQVVPPGFGHSAGPSHPEEIGLAQQVANGLGGSKCHMYSHHHKEMTLAEANHTINQTPLEGLGVKLTANL